MSKKISATVVADSVSPAGDRITTLELTFPRFILAELNTHRAFSRNSASSRARSARKVLEEVSSDPFVPVHWPSERVGMAGGEELTERDRLDAVNTWKQAADEAVEWAQALADAGVHKSIVNRVLEPYMWHTAVVTATEWDNFFSQRLALLEDGTPAAEPHFYDLARAMRTALDESKPVFRDVDNDDAAGWHLPYVFDTERVNMFRSDLLRLSVARCAGVSYLNQDTGRPHERDLALYERLATANPPHWSPFEHVAQPIALPGPGGSYVASESWHRRYNLVGWTSLRWFLENGVSLASVLQEGDQS